MARRFILVDQSVKKPGGHHYEYAKRILDAARAQGFETLLLAHKDYRGSVDHPVRPTFSLTFWDNYNHYYGGTSRPKTQGFLPDLASVRRSVDAWHLDLKRKIIFSRWGLALARARHISARDILFRPALPGDLSNVPTPRLILAAARLVCEIAPRVRKGLALASRIPRLSAVRRMGIVLLSPLILPFGTILLARAGRLDAGARFVNEFMQAVGRDAAGFDLLIFVPNATAAELEGFAWLCRAMHPAVNAHWALLYRRPVFSGYAESYKSQMENARRFRVEFARMREAAPDAKIKFYTDTDELTEQYNLLGVYPFVTLPVPVDLVGVAPTKENAPLVLGYLGDARDEKGFQLLPRIVESLTSERGDVPGVHFLFQANFNVPEGEPESRYSRSLLEQYDKCVVELVHGPLDSDEYAALARRMDIVFIPYSAENYSARSSGVIMEALAAGVPVLAPAASWMARLAEPIRKRHLIKLLDGQEPLARVSARHESINDKTLEIDDRATHVSIRLKFEDPFDGFVRIVICSINNFDIALETRRMAFKSIDNEVYAAFQKRPSAKLWWKAEAVAHDTRARFLQTEMCLYMLSESTPLDAGVGLYDGEDDIVRAARNMVDFYPHHKLAAEILREELRPLYDPACLVQMLSAQTTSSIGHGRMQEEASV